MSKREVTNLASTSGRMATAAIKAGGTVWHSIPVASLLQSAVHEGRLKLPPIFWATGRGSDVIQPMAIPSVGGMVVSVFVTIFIAPCLFCAVEEWKWKRAQRNLAHEN